MGKYSASRCRFSQLAAGVAALTMLLFCAASAGAASFLNSCTTFCHGTPVRDAARKGNPHFGSQSSAFLGNHKNHLSNPPSTSDCGICHAPVSTTSFGHQNNIIEMAAKLKGYSTSTGRARYSKGVFFNQTSIPNLTNATCSNVSCHFEKQTPAWGSAAYSPATSCNACHGAPPSGTATARGGGLAGSHARHDTYYPGTNNCQKCHPNNSTFIHASSAGRPLKVQGYLRNPLNTLESGATYSGNGANYLPSKSASQVFGSCNTIYCHSSSQSATGTATGLTYKAVTWGSAALSCAGCHVDEATDASGTGSHKIHTISTGANYDCARCHLGYTRTTVTTTTHANSLIELGAAGFTYSQGSGATHPAANGYGSCSASTCHGQGSVTWGATYVAPGNTFPYSTSQCDKCHSGTATAPFYSTAIPKVTANTDAKVGAHTSHLTTPDALAAALACADCHGSVTSVNSANHLSGSTNFTWSALATKNGALTPAYSATARSCSNVYCHGASMPGGDTSGSNKAPVWNSTTYLPATLTAAACGTCHGFPPPTSAGHPAVTIPAGFPATATIGTTCSCHSNVNTSGNSYANIFVNRALHVNGSVEVSGGHAFPFSGSLHMTAAGTTPWSGCIGCHANTAGGTYPVAAGTAPNCTGCHVNGLKAPSGTSSCWDCHGASATDGRPNGRTFPNYSGNHSVHTAITGVTCATCHSGGGSGTAGHGSGNRVAATAASVKVAFTGQGTAPLWTLSTKTCSTTNCHGQGTPAWGARTGATVNGFPYSPTQCAKCHSGNLASDVTAAKPFYSTAIPQVTANTNAKVGAHTSHLTAPDGLANTLACVACHGTVTLTSATHMNGSTNFTWSTLATKNGALTPTYTASTGVCANVYCHGASMPGGDTTGSNRAPSWTSSTYLPATIGSGGTACKTCHGFPPATASGHPALTTAVPATWGNGTTTIGTSCSCHSNINTAGTTYANIFVNRALHIDGTLQVSGGHAIPYDTHNAAVASAGGNTACLGCHAMGTVAAPGTYPAVGGAAPNCMSCHKKAAPLHTGTTAGANCSSCHGTSTSTTATSKGIPTGSAFPDNTKGHSRSDHKVVCSTCHVLGASGGTGSGINHGRGSTSGPVRDGKPGIVGPFTTGITPTGGSKGVAPSSVSCNHTTAGGGCGSGEGTKSW